MGITLVGSFEKDFLSHYLTFGLGSMSKTEVDALVMHLLDKYGKDGAGPMAGDSNQLVSEKLKTPVSKIKKLRYEAALKFGGRAEDQAMARLLAALSKASLESDGDKVCLVIEDTLAKNWLQGQLKIRQHIYDHSFNSEIVKVSFAGLCSVLDSLFDKPALEKLQKGYAASLKKAKAEERIEAFKGVAQKFATEAAKAAGGGVAALLKSYVGIV